MNTRGGRAATICWGAVRWVARTTLRERNLSRYRGPSTRTEVLAQDDRSVEMLAALRTQMTKTLDIIATSAQDDKRRKGVMLSERSPHLAARFETPLYNPDSRGSIGVLRLGLKSSLRMTESWRSGAICRLPYLSRPSIVSSNAPEVSLEYSQNITRTARSSSVFPGCRHATSNYRRPNAAAVRHGCPPLPSSALTPLPQDPIFV
jgi:hypothetical protein